MLETETLQHFKDARLDQLATFGNVAQFVSFGPDLRQRFSRISGFEPNHRFSGAPLAVTTLLDHSPERRINIRSFKPDDPQGHEFIYGIDLVDTAEQEIRRLTTSGLFVIVNETVDVNDGGVSGVAHGNVVEFAPGATPRVVETGKVVSVSRNVGERLLQAVYGFIPGLPKQADLRIEFSIHPIRRGFAHEHTIIWELQEVPIEHLRPIPKWPNAFSEFIGDKAFGLLLAGAVGLRVPRTTVLCRNIAPFTFGASTGSDVKWLRTCPRTPEPGFFPTVRGWTDPFELMQAVGHERLSSVLIQDEVLALSSGALLTDRHEQPIIEGVSGFGDDFMLGRVGPAQLDARLVDRLEELHATLLGHVGAIRAEWAFDGGTIWVIQLQQEAAVSSGLTIVPGEVESECEFDVSLGLSGLHELVELIKGRPVGIKLLGNVGMTSHIADVLRRYKVPSRIVTRTNQKDSSPFRQQL
jgi:hypothetical protein